MLNKKAQEEMIGFALIIILVAVILLVFFSLSVKNDDVDLSDAKIKNFLQTMPYYTTDCQGIRGDFREINDLVFDCKNGESCQDSRNSCQVLTNITKEIMQESWNVGENNSIKAYNFTIILDNEYLIMSLIQGELEGNFRGDYHTIPKSVSEVDFYLEIYS